jgi:hypothetical protein
MRKMLPALSLIAALALAGCSGSSSCTAGVTLDITGPPYDTVVCLWNPVPPNEPRCDSCSGDTRGGVVQLNASGEAVVSAAAAVGTENNSYTVNDFIPQGDGECSGTVAAPYGCPAPSAKFSLPCTRTAVGGAGGNMMVVGDEQSMTIYGGAVNRTIYDNGTVSVTLDGQTVSAAYGESSTGYSIAEQLAGAVANNSTLSGQFAVTALEGDVRIEALNGGTQYNYPWSTSCTHAPEFSFCSFSVTLQPANSLATQ